MKQTVNSFESAKIADDREDLTVLKAKMIPENDEESKLTSK